MWNIETKNTECAMYECKNGIEYCHDHRNKGPTWNRPLCKEENCPRKKEE